MNADSARVERLFLEALKHAQHLKGVSSVVCMAECADLAAHAVAALQFLATGKNCTVSAMTTLLGSVPSFDTRTQPLRPAAKRNVPSVRKR